MAWVELGLNLDVDVGDADGVYDALRRYMADLDEYEFQTAAVDVVYPPFEGSRKEMWSKRLDGPLSELSSCTDDDQDRRRIINTVLDIMYPHDG